MKRFIGLLFIYFSKLLFILFFSLFSFSPFDDPFFSGPFFCSLYTNHSTQLKSFIDLMIILFLFFFWRQNFITDLN